MCNNSREGTQKKLHGRIVFLLWEALERFLNVSMRTEMVPSHRMTSEIVSGFYLKDGRFASNKGHMLLMLHSVLVGSFDAANLTKRLANFWWQI